MTCIHAEFHTNWFMNKKVAARGKSDIYFFRPIILIIVAYVIIRIYVNQYFKREYVLAVMIAENPAESFML